MDQNNLYKKDLSLACKTQAPCGPIFIYMIDEIKILREYLGKKFNNLEISKKLKDKANEINFFESDCFKDWFKRRIDFYKSDWEKLTKNEEEIINDHIFLSETFKILDKYSWWAQDAYQSYSGAKDLLNNLDCIAACFEKDNNKNKDILIKKANNFCHIECDLRGKSSQDCDEKQNEKERQIFAFFAELKVAEELKNLGFQDIKFVLEEQKNKTPDLSAIKDNQVYYIEVKRIRKPRDEDEALRSTGQCNRKVKVNFNTPLKKKISDFICDTKAKFESINGSIKLDREHKILVIDFSPGIDARLNDNFSNSTLESIFGKGYFSELEETYNMQIWTRKYF